MAATFGQNRDLYGDARHNWAMGRDLASG